MSVTINGNPFPLFLQDSEETLKDRYCLQNDIIPKLCSFNIIRKDQNDIVETKSYNNVKYTLLKEKSYSLNSLEGSTITAKTFSELYEETDIDEEDFTYTFNKFAVKCMELFPFKNRLEVLFAYIIITNSDPENEDSYSISYERATSDTKTGYYKDLISNKTEYEVYFNEFKSSFMSLRKRVEEQINLSNKFSAFTTVLNKKKFSGVKTDIKQIKYNFSGDFVYPIDIYDLFNRFTPSFMSPYIRVGKYHKVKQGFKVVSDKWFDDFIESNLEDDESTLQIFVSGKEEPDTKDFFLVEIKQLSEVKSSFNFNITISISEQLEIKDETVIERSINSLIVNSFYPINLNLKKTFGTGYFVIKNFKLLDELFFDSCLNDPDINNFLIIDEAFKIQKERGGIKFFVSTNNLETSIKCSLVRKTIIRSSEDEVVAFPGIINVKDEIIIINILKGSSMLETLRLVDILIKSFEYIKETEKSFYDFYDRFLTNFSSNKDKVKQKEKKEKTLKLKDKYPQIFISGYARTFQHAPVFISEEQYYDDISKGIDAMIFPKSPEEGPQDYYSCSYDVKHKYVGVKENTLDNKDLYPLLPSCFSTDQNEPGKLRYNYEHNIKVEKEEGYKELIKSKKLLKEFQYGLLPDNISQTFTIVNNEVLKGNDRFLRLGIRQSIYSALYAIELSKKLGVNKKTPKDIKDINIDKYIKKIKDLADYNLLSQSNVKPQDVKNIIDKKLNIDPIFFLDILESIFEVNIIIFCRDRELSKEGTMCSPNFRRNYILNTKKGIYSETVILYRTNGGEFDKVPYPHIELLCLESDVEKEEGVGKVQCLFKTKDNFISQLFAIYYSYLDTIYTSVNLNNKIIGQYEDGSGKIRILHCLYKGEELSILTSPIPSFPLKQFDTTQKAIYSKNIKEANPETIISFFISEGINDIRKVIIKNKIVGLFGTKGTFEMYIPCKDIKFSSTLVKDFDTLNKELPAPTNLTFSILNQYNSFLKLSNYVTAYSQYIFSKLYTEDLKVLQMLVTQKNQSQLIKEILLKFESNIKVKVNHDYGDLKRELSLSGNNIIKDNNTLILTSDTIKKKVLYFLYIQLKYNLPNLIEYSFKKYVENFYTSSKDFDIKENFNIFYTLKELRLYMKPIDDPYKVYTSIPYIKTFYYKNINIDEDSIFRATKVSNIENGLFIGYNWEKKKSISLYSTNTIDANSVNFNIYELTEGDNVIKHEFINNTNPIVLNLLLAKFDKEEDVSVYILIKN
jgi:hypothetical protein